MKPWMGLLSSVLIGTSVFAVSAQEVTPDAQAPDRDSVVRRVVLVVAEETGLEAREILADLGEGLTAAEIIEANGGDTQAVIDQVVIELTTLIEARVAAGTMPTERAERLLENLETVVTDAFNGDWHPDRPVRDRLVNGNERVLIRAVMDETGAGVVEVLGHVRAGGTLAELIEANGGSIDAVIDAAVAESEANLAEAVANGRMSQEQADIVSEGLEAFYTEALNAVPGEVVQRRVGLAVVRSAAQQTGLEARVIRERLQGGETLGAILTAEGVDPQVFIDDVVANAETRIGVLVTNGRLTQERADELIARFREGLTLRVNGAEV